MTRTSTVCHKAGYTVCTFTHPAADPESDPASISSWVFTETDKEPIMIAELLGGMGDFAAIAPQLAEIKPCPRPSQDK
jgi:hypothetical protein